MKLHYKTVAIDIPSGKQSLVQKITAWTTILNKAISNINQNSFFFQKKFQEEKVCATELQQAIKLQLKPQLTFNTTTMFCVFCQILKYLRRETISSANECAALRFKTFLET